MTSYLLTHKVENFCTQFEPFWVHWGVYSKEQKEPRGTFHPNLMCHKRQTDGECYSERSII